MKIFHPTFRQPWSTYHHTPKRISVFPTKKFYPRSTFEISNVQWWGPAQLTNVRQHWATLGWWW